LCFKVIIGGMDSLQEILGRKSFEPPDEITSIKEFVKRRYDSPCRIKLERDTIVLSVPSSALAATLQLERQQLIAACGITKKLFIRTGR
jgi:hypothetical protein